MKNKILVAYFSATGTTAHVAKEIAMAAGAELFEIKPRVPYTEKDLDWTDRNSRSSLEMRDPSSRPEIAERKENMPEYDTVILGFPIWWYVAPTIIHTFLESYDFSGKRILPFATSGGSGFGNTENILKRLCSNQTKWKKGKIWNGKHSREEYLAWVRESTDMDIEKAE